MRRVNLRDYECKCLSRDPGTIIGIPNGGGSRDPRTYMECEKVINSDGANFNADSKLKNFLTVSNTSLRTSEGTTSGSTINICSSSRVVDITTVYLVKLMGLHMNNFITKYVFKTNLTLHSFPGTHSPTYIPDNVGGLPNLEQVFWSIMDQYTNITEPGIRNVWKDKMWCHYHGVGVFKHCRVTHAESNCGGNSNSHCVNVWKYFMDACHRVRSLNPQDNNYKVVNNRPLNKCMSSSIADSGNSIWYLHRSWQRECPDMELKLHHLANNTLATGWLERVGAASGFHVSYRIPGTTMKYKCSNGFDLPNGTNPNQLLSCSANRKVDTTHIDHCERE